MAPFWVNVYEFSQKLPLSGSFEHCGRKQAEFAAKGGPRLLYRIKVTPKVAAP